MRAEKIEAVRTSARWSGPMFWGTAALLAFLAYAAVFLAVRMESVGEAALASLRNLVPLAGLSLAARAVLRSRILGLPPVPQLAAHIVLAFGFSVAWYWLLMVVIGLALGPSPLRFEVRPFWTDPAVTWQLLQGMTVYALVAALVALRDRAPAGPETRSEGPAPAEMAREPVLSRYFIRRGEDILPVEVASIVSIAGADDYAEVRTVDGRHLVRMTLAELESALPTERFIRAHRSHIINVDRVLRAEPAGGGRMLLHMEDGEIIQASRAGTRLLRDRVI